MAGIRNVFHRSLYSHRGFCPSPNILKSCILIRRNEVSRRVHVKERDEVSRHVPVNERDEVSGHVPVNERDEVSRHVPVNERDEVSVVCMLMSVMRSVLFCAC